MWKINNFKTVESKLRHVTYTISKLQHSSKQIQEHMSDYLFSFSISTLVFTVAPRRTSSCIVYRTSLTVTSSLLRVV